MCAVDLCAADLSTVGFTFRQLILMLHNIPRVALRSALAPALAQNRLLIRLRAADRSVVGSCMTPSQKRTMATIGTHSGTFHCDEALGCFLLKQTQEYKDADIVRSRDPSVLEKLDIVIDVGGEYNAGRNRFDHHQRGFEEVFGHGFTTKLSSAGLVYKHFGQSIVSKLLNQPEDSSDAKIVYLSVYRNFMEAIDGIDNGVSQWPTTGNKQRYTSRTDLASRVGGLNTRWNQDSSNEATDAAFRKAVALTGSEFLEAVDYVAKCWLPARQLVEEAVNSRKQIDDSGEIIMLSQGGVPWKEHLYELEHSLGIPPVKFCLYEDDREHKWRIQAVSESAGSFVNRKSLPKAWQGLRDSSLDKAAGIDGCVFVHASGFIGGHATRDGVLQMARKALTEE